MWMCNCLKKAALKDLVKAVSMQCKNQTLMTSGGFRPTQQKQDSEKSSSHSSQSSSSLVICPPAASCRRTWARSLIRFLNESVSWSKQEIFFFGGSQKFCNPVVRYLSIYSLLFCQSLNVWQVWSFYTLNMIVKVPVLQQNWQSPHSWETNKIIFSI